MHSSVLSVGSAQGSMDVDADAFDMDWELADSLSGTPDAQQSVPTAAVQLTHFRPWIWQAPAGQQALLLPWIWLPPVRRVRIPGFLEQVPDSWLCHFVRSLPAASKKALFECSRHLARFVVGSATGVTLNLQDKAAITFKQTVVRSTVITQFMGHRREFAVKLWPAAWQPFPSGISNRVTSITVYTSVDVAVMVEGEKWIIPQALAKPVVDCCHWAAMAKLRKVCLVGFAVTLQDVNGLCEAVEEGQLQQLRSMELHLREAPPNLELLVCTLGPQLEELTSNCRPLVMKANQLKALRCLDVGNCRLTEDMMKQLCEHPTLCHLTLYHSLMEGDHSQCRCRWKSLTLWNTEMGKLPLLPLSGVQKVCLVVDVADVADQLLHDPKAVELTIAQHAHKMVCQASKQAKFTLWNPSEAMAPLVKHMRGVKTLVLMYDVSSTDVVPMLWQALPATVTRIVLQEATGVAWAQLWQGLPQHVSHITLHHCEVSTPVLCTLVCTAPMHVQTIVLCPSSASVRAAWGIAAKHPLAPRHLQVQLR